MLARINVVLGGLLDEIHLVELPWALLVKQPLGADLTSVVQPIRNPARQTADGCSGKGSERGDDGSVHRRSSQPAAGSGRNDHRDLVTTMVRTTVALRKSVASFVALTNRTRTIAFGRGTGFEAVAARARVARPTPARSESRCCANDRPQG